jgi:hypothetical protein
LFVGLVLKLFPGCESAAFQVIFLLFGVITAFSLYHLAELVGVNKGIAVALVGFYMVSPGTVLSENFLLYEYPLLALLSLSAVVFYYLVRDRTAGLAHLFFWLLFALMMVRNLFQLAWFVLATAVTAWLLRSRWRMIAAAAAIPFLIGFTWNVKNAIMYGTFNSSTWMGFNISTITAHQLTAEEKARFTREGHLSIFASMEGLVPLSYYGDLVKRVPPRGIPILDRDVDAGGRPNFNNLSYDQLKAAYMSDGKWVLLHYQKAYLRSVVKAFWAYFLPPTDFPFWDFNRPHITRWERIFNLVVCGQFKTAETRKDLRKMEAGGASVLSLALYTGVFLMIALPATFFYGMVVFWKAIRNRSWSVPKTAVVAFALFHIAMITAIVNLLSCFENNRYRQPIEGFYVVIFAMAVQAVWTRWKGHLAR